MPRLFKFKDVIGNNSIKNICIKALERNAFPRFSLFSGESGIGKSTCAEISALRLICENPDGAEPCGVCNNCTSGMASIVNKGKCRRLHKINMASINSNSELENLIEQVFRIDNGSLPTVYIFEEIHSLSKAYQTALLEEVDKLENVYVIACTTQPSSLLKELRNRSIHYKFKRLSAPNSRMLVDRECDRNNVKLSNSVKNKILGYSKGIPRNIVNITEHIIKLGHLSESEIDDLLNSVSTDNLRALLKFSGDTTDFLQFLDTLLEMYDYNDLLYNLKSYVMECCFLSKNLSYRETYLKPEDKRFATELGFNTLLKVYNELNKYNKGNMDDCKFTLILSSKVIQKAQKKLSSEPITEASVSERVAMANSNRESNLSEIGVFSKATFSMLEERTL